MKKFLSGNQIKLIAIIAMTMQHAALIFWIPGTNDWTLTSPFRWIGNLTFILLIYMLIEGFEHTRNRAKYMLRLFIFSLISIIPFVLFIGHKSIGRFDTAWDLLLFRFEIFYQSLSMKNIFGFGAPLQIFSIITTMLIGLIIITLIDKMKNLNIGVRIPLEILLVMLGMALNKSCDWYASGVLGIYIMYKLPKPKRALWGPIAFFFTTSMMVSAIKVFGFLNPEDWSFSQFTSTLYTAFEQYSAILLAAPLLLLYNGQRGKYNLKWLFYIYYPTHFIILFVLMWIGFIKIAI